ncbi:MAG: acetyl-CoA carboxylase biotin carboxyl carrier protein [Oscillospiraceae bacterium]|jgi:acetyl-CoA carboxylase biotin carboxyl carrier protein|nr:acetyl-CoA carboxylase biotin carboxyl carrier protein [Oscillospiraceae bacterium]
MELENIRALARIAAEHNLTRLEIGEGATRIVIERGNAGNAHGHAPAPQFAPPEYAESESADLQEQEPPAQLSRTRDVKSPIVGVFYAAAAPDAEPFVSIGSEVRRGDVLCLVETMKLMNEITADRDGTVTDVCLRDGDVCQYGQVLFKLEEAEI